MPASFIIRPIEANLTHNTELIGRMDPYCSFIVGGNRIRGQVCKKGGKHPHWNDTVTIPTTNEPKILVELMDKDKITRDDSIGSFTLDLQEVEARGQVSRWYPLYHKNKPAGEILMEAVFKPDTTATAAGAMGMGMKMNTYGHVYEEEKYYSAKPNTMMQENEIIAEQHNDLHHGTTGHNVITEQKQIVEPHTFVKEVEVVETRPALQEIEVTKPVKVLKDIQVTEAVPVKKQIEVTEPQVVKKEVEVIEPRLVTKTIQVVENVPVKKEVEVVEMKNTLKEVDTVEPHTFNKQVEVTEYVPAKKQVEVTQPVTVKKAVEFVEPVITTQTVTKEVQQPVIVDEKITTAVGPASVVGVEATSEYREQNVYANGMTHDHHHHHHHPHHLGHHHEKGMSATKKMKEEVNVHTGNVTRTDMGVGTKLNNNNTHLNY